jgi:hypothetical protein
MDFNHNYYTKISHIESKITNFIDKNHSFMVNNEGKSTQNCQIPCTSV